MCIIKGDNSMQYMKMERRGGVYSDNSHKLANNIMYKKAFNSTCGCESSVTGNEDDYHQTCLRGRKVGRRNGLILTSTQTKKVVNAIATRSQAEPAEEPLSYLTMTKQKKENDEESSIHDPRSDHQRSSRCTKIKIKDNYVILDGKRGIDSSYEGANRLFLDILNTYYSEEYARASSNKTQRRLILNVILDDMYTRGFEFMWYENGNYQALENDMVILKKIRSSLVRETRSQDYSQEKKCRRSKDDLHLHDRQTDQKQTIHKSKSFS